MLAVAYGIMKIGISYCPSSSLVYSGTGGGHSGQRFALIFGKYEAFFVFSENNNRKHKANKQLVNTTYSSSILTITSFH